MSWDYAEMSKAAKACGGPEKWVETLINSGKMKMVPWLFVTFAVGIGVQKGITFLPQKKAVSKSEIKSAKEKIIKGIKDYDRTQEEMDLNKKNADIALKNNVEGDM